ncbi:MAG: DUF481 domain-containing protein [Alcanivoracaceae bacterium]|nr:DUF481 domain-containing protein [Alcanivoracaceae bacterium]
MKMMKLALATLVASGAVSANAAEAGKLGWTADMAASLILERGNSESNAVNGNLNAAREGVLWRNTIKAEGTNKEERVTDPVTGKDDYVRTGERYYGLYKLDRKLGENSANYFFNVGTYEKDAFSGFHYQATYALGLGRRFISNDKHTLDAEIGPGYRWRCLEPQDGYFSCDQDDNEPIARIAAKYKWLISDTADFSQEVSTEAGEDGASTRAESVLNSKINAKFSLRVRYLLEHESEPGPGAKEADHEFTVGLVYTIK